MDISLEEGKIVLAPVQRRARAGWAAASKTRSEAGDNGLVWPEFANADDANLDW